MLHNLSGSFSLARFYNLELMHISAITPHKLACRPVRSAAGKFRYMNVECRWDLVYRFLVGSLIVQPSWYLMSLGTRKAQI